jgi:hypothetical protein
MHAFTMCTMHVFSPHNFQLSTHCCSSRYVATPAEKSLLLSEADLSPNLSKTATANGLAQQHLQQQPANQKQQAVHADFLTCCQQHVATTICWMAFHKARGQTPGAAQQHMTWATNKCSRQICQHSAPAPGHKQKSRTIPVTTYGQVTAVPCQHGMTQLCH